MKLVEKTNNPLNIRYSERNKWKGQTTQLKGFCVFKSMDYGYRAAYVLLCNYIKRGYNTLDKIIQRFAPPTENDTENYIEFVSRYTFIHETQELKNETEWDYWTIILIICAMARMETGLEPQPQDINIAIANTL